jgi:hypothetical protein
MKPKTFRSTEHYFEYISPLNREVKRLGYALPLEPTEQDIMMTMHILGSSASDLDMFIPLLNDWHKRDIAKPPIRIYAYYMNNPQQFNHNPNNIVGSMIRSIINATCSILINFYSVKLEIYPRAKGILVRKFKEQALNAYFTSAKDLSARVKHNTLLERESEQEDLNLEDKINVSLFR